MGQHGDLRVGRHEDKGFVRTWGWTWVLPYRMMFSGALQVVGAVLLSFALSGHAVVAESDCI